MLLVQNQRYRCYGKTVKQVISISVVVFTCVSYLRIKKKLAVSKSIDKNKKNLIS